MASSLPARCAGRTWTPTATSTTCCSSATSRRRGSRCSSRCRCPASQVDSGHPRGAPRDRLQAPAGPPARAGADRGVGDEDRCRHVLAGLRGVRRRTAPSTPRPGPRWCRTTSPSARPRRLTPEERAWLTDYLEPARVVRAHDVARHRPGRAGRPDGLSHAGHRAGRPGRRTSAGSRNRRRRLVGPALRGAGPSTGRPPRRGGRRHHRVSAAAARVAGGARRQR